MKQSGTHVCARKCRARRCFALRPSSSLSHIRQHTARAVQEAVQRPLARKEIRRRPRIWRHQGLNVCVGIFM